MRDRSPRQLRAKPRPSGSPPEEGLGREGVLVGLAGPVRRPGGLYQPSGYVDDPSATDGQPRRRIVALADLERFE